MGLFVIAVAMGRVCPILVAILAFSPPHYVQDIFIGIDFLNGIKMIIYLVSSSNPTLY